MIRESVLDKIQEAVSLVGIAESRNLDLEPIGDEYRCPCPFHGDSNPSLHVNDRVAHCFGCDWKGNVFQFIVELDQSSFIEAVRECAKKGNVDLEHVDLHELQVEQELAEKTSKILTAAITYWTKKFKKTKAARQYVKSRGVDLKIAKEHQVGYDDGDLISYLVADEGFDKRDLKILKLSNKTGNSRFHGRIVIPIVKDGRVINVYGRALQKGAKIPHLYLRENEGLFGYDGARKYKKLWAVEACFDALVMLSKGVPNVIAQLGTQGFKDEYIYSLYKTGVEEVKLLPDHDKAKAGKKSPESFIAATKTIARILNQGVGASVGLLPKAGEDPADHFCRGGTTADIKLYEPIRWAQEHPAPTKTLTARRISPLGAGPDKHKELEVKVGKNTWSITRTSQSSSGLKGLLIVTDGKGDETYKDTVNLWSAAKRKVISTHVGLDERIVNKICAVLESAWEMIGKLDQDERKTRKKARGSKDLPTYAKEMAGELQQSETLIADIEQDIEMMGYVGEPENKVLLYLIGLSAQMADPLGAFIASESSAGKSAMVDAVTKLFPPDQVYMISRMTPQALYYIEEFELSHKWLVIAERQGAVGDENADYNLRTFFSERQLTLMVPEKDEATGRITTRKHTVRGPIAYTETTTDIGIHDENATRLIELNIREDEKQTAAIHSHQKRLAAMDQSGMTQAERNMKRTIMKHHAFLSTLSPVEVRIPFAEHIEFPTHLTRARRDLLKFLGIIKAVAFLHQFQREVKTSQGTSYIEADLEDYRMAYELSRSSIRKAFSAIPDRSAELLKAIFEVLMDTNTGEVDTEDEEISVFTIKDLRDAGVKRAPATIKKYLVPLIEQDLLESLEEGGRGRGKAARYRMKVATLSDASEPISKNILTPELMEERVGESNQEEEFNWDE